MSEAQPTSPVSPEADNSGDIYNPVLRTIAQSEQRAALVRRCCTAAQHSASAWWLMAYSTGMPPA
ncbi:Uncharacterised protein [Shigella sonnei]|nr:hypothetical protein [Shigella sonnei]SJE13520.1 Uncharacterised protein [Shigella sonnei]